MRGLVSVAVSVAVWVAMSALVAACGDNARPCNYVEHDDLGNATAAEPTKLTIGAGATTVCGTIGVGDSDPQLGELDRDRYQATVSGTSVSTELLVEISGDDGLALLDDIAVDVFGAGSNPALLAEGRLVPSLAAHGAFIADVPPGDLELAVTAMAHGVPSAAVGYRVRISGDPGAACPPITGRVDYREAHDGAESTDNDRVAIDFARDPSFTIISGDPEPTGLAIGAGQAYHLTGTASAIAHSDAYLDRDTYELRTDDTTNELTIRLDWSDTAADLDYVVFEKATFAPVAIAHQVSTAVHELETFAVKPSTTYWLWIGRHLGAVASTTEVSYDAAVCGGHLFY